VSQTSTLQATGKASAFLILMISRPIAHKGFFTIGIAHSRAYGYDFVLTRFVSPRKSVFADRQAARELVCDIGSMPRLRMTPRDTLRTCGAYKTDMGPQAKAKMTLFASKLDCAFVDSWIIGGSFQSCVYRVADRTNHYGLVVCRWFVLAKQQFSELYKKNFPILLCIHANYFQNTTA